MAGKLQGKIAIVTGGTSGIGLATARRFAAEGASVMITGRRQTELEDAVAAIPNAIGISVDSAKLSDLDHLFARVAEDMGRIDILFVNAGGGSLLPLGQITLEQYEDTFGRNVRSVLFTVQKALPFLAAGASVILVGSTAGSSGATVAVFLASDESSFVNGIELFVDGGQAQIWLQIASRYRNAVRLSQSPNKAIVHSHKRTEMAKYS